MNEAQKAFGMTQKRRNSSGSVVVYTESRHPGGYSCFHIIRLHIDAAIHYCKSSVLLLSVIVSLFLPARVVVSNKMRSQ